MAGLNGLNRWQQLWLAVVVVSLLTGDVLRACPFCLSPPMTLVQEVATSDMVVIVELLRFDVVRSGKVQVPFSTVRIREFLQGSELASKCGRLQTGRAIVVRQEIAGEPGDLFLLFGSLPASDLQPESTFAVDTEDSQTTLEDNGGVVTADLKTTGAARNSIQRSTLLIPELISWSSSTPVSLEAIRYIKDAPSESLPQVRRLPYYIGFLENPDPLLSIDAWAEFANSTYDDVKSTSDKLPRQKLRQWIADPMMSPERLGLYGMMLGLCGNADDAAFLESQIGAVPPTGKDETQFFRYGTDGLMGGYLLLTAEKGLEFIEQTRLIPDVPAESAHAAAQAMQFIWSYESNLIPPSRLKLSMRRLLANEDLRLLTIMNLARWNDWECWPDLEQMFRNEQVADFATQRAIVEFANECRKATDADGNPLEIASAADQFLMQAELMHPELFRSVNNAEFRSP